MDCGLDGLAVYQHNVLVTDWLPALQVNKLADLSVIHGGIGTAMTAAFAGKPVVGVGIQPEQDANIACLVRTVSTILITGHPAACSISP